MFSCISPQNNENSDQPEDGETGTGDGMAAGRNRERKPSVIRQLYDKLRRSKSPPAPDGGEEISAEEMREFLGLGKFGTGENDEEEEDSEENKEKRFDTGMELAQELRTAFDLYSKVGL